MALFRCVGLPRWLPVVPVAFPIPVVAVGGGRLPHGCTLPTAQLPHIIYTFPVRLIGRWIRLRFTLFTRDLQYCLICWTRSHVGCHTDVAVTTLRYRFGPFVPGYADTPLQALDSPDCLPRCDLLPHDTFILPYVVVIGCYVGWLVVNARPRFTRVGWLILLDPASHFLRVLCSGVAARQPHTHTFKLRLCPRWAQLPHLPRGWFGYVDYVIWDVITVEQLPRLRFTTLRFDLLWLRYGYCVALRSHICRTLPHGCCLRLCLYTRCICVTLRVTLHFVGCPFTFG